MDGVDTTGVYANRHLTKRRVSRPNHELPSFPFVSSARIAVNPGSDARKSATSHDERHEAVAPVQEEQLMDTALLIARLILAAVFAVAGVAKLLDRDGTREGLEGFGVPARIATPGALILPLVEIAVAVLLLPVA